MREKSAKSKKSYGGYQLTIAWLYPELMSTYGDRGNIICFKRRCQWRGIKMTLRELKIGNWKLGRKPPDLLFMGGGEDWQQKIVAEDLQKKKEFLQEMIEEEEVVGLFICGAYQFMGKYYQAAEGTKIPGLGIMDYYTVHPGEGRRRLVGNCLIKPIGVKGVIRPIVGFENHGGRTYLGEGVRPLGQVIKGYGNNGEDGFEGAVYKNIVGTYLHGPILPKNPHLADWLIKKALVRKYQNKVKLEKLEDSLEWQAHKAVCSRLLRIWL